MFNMADCLSGRAYGRTCRVETQEAKLERQDLEIEKLKGKIDRVLLASCRIDNLYLQIRQLVK